MREQGSKDKSHGGIWVNRFTQLQPPGKSVLKNYIKSFWNSLHFSKKNYYLNKQLTNTKSQVKLVAKQNDHWFVTPKPWISPFCVSKATLYQANTVRSMSHASSLKRHDKTIFTYYTSCILKHHWEYNLTAISLDCKWADTNPQWHILAVYEYYMQNMVTLVSLVISIVVPNLLWNSIVLCPCLHAKFSQNVFNSCDKKYSIF